MTSWNRAVFALESSLALAALAGLVFRRHLRAAVWFGIYLVVVAGSDVLVLSAPGRFFTLRFWLVREAAQAVAKIGLSFELAARIFQSLPRARANVTGLVALVCAATALVVAVSSADARGVVELAGTVVPWLQYGAAFALLVVLGGSFWYLVPVYRLHRAVLGTLTVYLFASTFGLRALAQWGWGLRDWLNYASGVAFSAVLAYWTREAWRPYALDAEHFEVFRFLRPWAAARRS